MTIPTQKLLECLGRLIGLHRQLLENVRQEKGAVTEARLTEVQELTYAKEALVESIRQIERERSLVMAEFARAFKKPVAELTLTAVIQLTQNVDQAAADQMRSVQATLSLLIDRIRDQIRYNQGLIDRSLGHLEQMKKNVLGEREPKTETYGPGAMKRQPTSGQAKLLSTEI